MALPPINPAQAGVSALPEIMKLISSFKQLSEAKKLEKTPNPQYNIPGQIREVTDTSRMNYLDPRIPGQNILEQNIRAGASNAMNQARGISGGSGDALSALASINNGQNQQFNQLAVQGQQQQMSDLNNLNSALTNEAQYADKAWQWNKQQPYLNAMKSAGALRQASAENLFGAVNNLAGIGNTIDTKSLFGKGEKSLLPSTEQSSIGKSLGDMANAAKAVQSVNSMDQPSMMASDDVSVTSPSLSEPTITNDSMNLFAQPSMMSAPNLGLPADQNMTYKAIYPNGSTGTMSLTELLNLQKQYPDLFK